MKFVYVCRGCGSADITEKCGKLINEEEKQRLNVFIKEME